MYTDDMPIIRAYALEKPENLANVILFALLTIKQPFSGVAASYAEVQSIGDRSAFLFGDKRKGWQYAKDHRATLHGAMVAAVATCDAIGAIDVLLNVPNLGPVKAGFVAQMLGLPVGCLDSRNQSAHGLKRSQIDFHKGRVKRPETRRRKIAAYVSLCDRLGGAGRLWDAWCEAYASSSFGRRYDSGEAVSRAHSAIFGLARPQVACPF